MIGLPTVTGPATTPGSGQGLPTTAYPNIIAPQLIVNNPLRTQVLATTAANINNPYKFRAFQTNAQVFSTQNSIALVDFDTITFDTSGGFSTTSFNYTVKIKGYYYLFAVLNGQFSAAQAQAYIVPYIFVNGVQQTQGPRTDLVFANATAEIAAASISDTLHLNQGDVVDIRCLFHANGGATYTTTTGFNQTYWSMHLVSADG